MTRPIRPMRRCDLERLPAVHVVHGGETRAEIRTEEPCAHARTRVERVADRDLWDRSVPREARICTKCGAVVEDVPIVRDAQPARIGGDEP